MKKWINDDVSSIDITRKKRRTREDEPIWELKEAPRGEASTERHSAQYGLLKEW